MKLKDGTYVQYGKKVFVVSGLNDCNQPLLIDVNDGDYFSGAIYAAHLMNILEGFDIDEYFVKKHAKAKKPLVFLDVDEKAVERTSEVVEEPAKKRRGRPPKARSEPVVAAIQFNDVVDAPVKKRRGRPPKNPK